MSRGYGRIHALTSFAKDFGAACYLFRIVSTFLMARKKGLFMFLSPRRQL